SGFGRRRAGPSTTAGGWTYCRGWRNSRGSSWGPACTSTSWHPSRPRPSCATRDRGRGDDRRRDGRGRVGGAPVRRGGAGRGATPGARGGGPGAARSRSAPVRRAAVGGAVRRAAPAGGPRGGGAPARGVRGPRGGGARGRLGGRAPAAPQAPEGGRVDRGGRK